MKFDPRIHQRYSIRLEGYDYSRAGAYFVTICTRGRECVFDDPVVAGITRDVWEALPKWFPTIALDEFVIMPNHAHLIVWLQSPGDDVGATLAVAQAVAQDMVAQDGRAGARPAPTGDDNVGATLAVAQNAVAQDAIAPDSTTREWTIPQPTSVNSKPTLGDVMGAFKSVVFTVYLNWVETHAPNRRAKFWQRNYYEHIVRNDRELRAIRQYIRDNPLKWKLDRDNPATRHPVARTVGEYLEEAGAL